MLRTYRALLKRDKLKWVDEVPGNLSKDKGAFVFVTILDKDMPGSAGKDSLVEFFKSSLLYDSQLDLKRDTDFGREVEL
ncbi:MAG: hypothetical protein KAW12_05495 [Candidatus Aminicenantes bacterium]|nr:hypothetical protein [Candidatus Aminicenantes bacterium]